MQGWLESIWYRAQPPPLALRPLAQAYQSISERLAARRRACAEQLPVPVIVVGNVAVGGTGKTPATLWLVEELRRRGWRPGILSRGYRGRGPFPREVQAHSSPRECGDEPVLLAQRAQVPIAAAPDRVAAGRWLLERHPDLDLLICDDGLQHYRLARNVEVCVIDGSRGFGNRWLLPAGPLREPAGRAALAQLILVNGGDAVGYGGQAERFDLRITQAVALASGEARPLQAFAPDTIDAIAGIGNPQRFFDALRAAGVSIREHVFPDHYAYRVEDLLFAGDSPILMTEKDAVKCRDFARPNWWQVPAQLHFAADAAVRAGERVAVALAGSGHRPRDQPL